MAKKPIDLGLTALDELFMTEEGRQESRLPRIHDIPIELIDDFPDHPFQVRLDEDMDQLVESIRTNGIITPITLREKDNGRYEIVSGHRRKKACEIVGLSTVKSEIREMTRDEAIILMVESNLQRSVILPSEKAFSYKRRLEAMKRQAGRPGKENMAREKFSLSLLRYRFAVIELPLFYDTYAVSYLPPAVMGGSQHHSRNSITGDKSGRCTPSR